MKKIFLILSIFFSVFLICFGYFFGKRGAILDSNLEKKLSLLSVQKGGREMPLSSASSDVLRTIYGKASYEMPDGSHLSASEWIFYANANPLEVCNLKCFKTDNRELQNLLGLKGRYFSYNDFEKIVEKAYETAYAKEETLFVKACKDAIANIALFEDASTSFCFFFQDSSPLKTYLLWDNLVEEASSELKKSKEENRTPNHEKLMPMYEMLKLFEESFERFESRKTANIYAIKNDEAYTSAIAMIFDRSARSESGVAYYKAMAQTLEDFAKKDFVAFEKNLEVLHIQNPSSKRVSFENFFNRLDIFYRSALLYMISLSAYLLSLASKKLSESLKISGTTFLIFAILSQCFGVIARIYIQMRPPVTNLYSSIIFAGLAAAILGFVLYLAKKDRSYAISSAISGGLSVVVALNMAYSGDTMGMMRAVLNSNFWLTVHIVPMMLGYCGVFLAGFAASFRVITNLFSKNQNLQKVVDFSKGIFNVVCFAMAFSFAGTMLGGIWAEASWGRFWGWDPKENGALMVVLWCALIVHGYAMKIFSQRVFLSLCAFANIVAAWAWFGVNMMGIGLHSYGFMEGGAFYLASFITFQFIVCLLAFFPKSKAIKIN